MINSNASSIDDADDVDPPTHLPHPKESSIHRRRRAEKDTHPHKKIDDAAKEKHERMRKKVKNVHPRDGGDDDNGNVLLLDFLKRMKFLEKSWWFRFYNILRWSLLAMVLLLSHRARKK